MFKIFLFFLCLSSLLSARQIDTFYGSLEVEEPVLLELIDSPAMQRLKHIHQYGVAYYTTHREEYNRYDHSIGVFAILRIKQASLEEQIAGLLHDVSHTVFSHVGDWIFEKAHQDKDYQNSIHATFLEESRLGDILRKYGLSVDCVLPIQELHPALENALPNLCADRIDYNIQGAYYQGFISYEEGLLIVEDMIFIETPEYRWVSHHPELMKKLALFSLFMTQNCWGSPTNDLTSRWLAEAILRAMALGDLTYTELHYSTDDIVWNRLIKHSDPIIQKNIKKILHADDYFSLVDSDVDSDQQIDLIVRSKFRGVNPWIMTDSDVFRLTELDSDFDAEYQCVKKIMENGWKIRFKQQCANPEKTKGLLNLFGHERKTG